MTVVLRSAVTLLMAGVHTPQFAHRELCLESKNKIKLAKYYTVTKERLKLVALLLSLRARSGMHYRLN